MNKKDYWFVLMVTFWVGMIGLMEDEMPWLIGILFMCMIICIVFYLIEVFRNGK